jgi:hypothetical protein
MSDARSIAERFEGFFDRDWEALNRFEARELARRWRGRPASDSYQGLLALWRAAAQALGREPISESEAESRARLDARLRRQRALRRMPRETG